MNGNNVSNQNVVTGSRALGVVYQNTNPTPMWVSVTVTDASGVSMQAVSDSSSSPTTVISGVVAATTAFVIFIVLPGNYYQTDAPGSTLNYWIEWH